GLVFDGVGRTVLSVDVWRKRNMTVGRKKVVGRGTDVKQSKTMLANFPKNSVQFSIRKDNAVTFPNTFAGRHRTSHALSLTGAAKKTSTSRELPFARSSLPMMRAGMTRVSLRTRTSDGCKNSGNLRNSESIHRPVARSRTIMRDASRGRTGSCAISPGGNS